MENKLLELHLNQKAETPCIKVVGSFERVAMCADIWAKYGDLFQLIITDGLVDFCTTEEFDSKEVTAFQKGMNIIPTFLMEAYGEIELMKSKETQEKS